MITISKSLSIWFLHQFFWVVGMIVVFIFVVTLCQKFQRVPSYDIWKLAPQWDGNLRCTPLGEMQFSRHRQVLSDILALWGDFQEGVDLAQWMIVDIAFWTRAHTNTKQSKCFSKKASAKYSFSAFCFFLHSTQPWREQSHVCSSVKNLLDEIKCQKAKMIVDLVDEGDDGEEIRLSRTKKVGGKLGN